MSNWYCALADLRERLALPASARTDLDDQIGRIISEVSRQFDLECGRVFFVSHDTRQFTYSAYPGTLRESLLPDDLLAIDENGMRTDPSGTRTYPTIWATTDYDLLPTEAPFQSPPAPYWRIGLRPFVSLYFPSYPLGIQTAGDWGRYDVRVRLATAVGDSGIDDQADSTSLPVDALDEFSVGQTLRIGDEQVFVTALVTTDGEMMDPPTYSLTLERAVNGSTLASHAEDDPIGLYTYPVVGELCLEQAKRRYERSIGRSGRETEPGIRNFGSLDRDILDGLSKLKRRAVA